MRLRFPALFSILLLAALGADAQVAADAAPDPARGKALAETVCAACHNVDGNSALAANPKLAGQHYGYLLKQLKNFQSSSGKAPARNNPIMAGMVAAFSEDQLRDLAAWFAAQKIQGDAARDKARLALGEKIYRSGDLTKGLPACAACHGPNGAGMPEQYPRLGGQFADYTEAQLKAFRSGERSNDPAAMMRTIAGRMTDAEISAVADYIANLR